MTLTMMKLTRVVSAAACAALGVFTAVACSSVDEQGELGYSASEDVGEIAAPINKNCWKTASTTVESGFASTYTSAATYDDCFKGKVVQIDSYAPEYAVGGYTEVRWAGAQPSTKDCLGSLLWVYLFEQRGDEWVFLKSKSAHGDLLYDNEPGDIQQPPGQPGAPQLPDSPLTPVKPGDLGGAIKGPPLLCRSPVAYFHTDDMVAGRSYRIAVSARLGSPEGATQKVSFKSKASTCGQVRGDECCTAGDACVDGLDCGSSGECETCGASGEICCGTSCDSTSLVCSGGKCTPCGASGQECCFNDKCNAGTTCSSGTCKQECGKNGQACCSSGSACGSGLTCQSGTCKTKPCGGSGQECCSSGSACGSGLTCQSGTCKKPACGGLLGECCPGANPCNSTSLACVGGYCNNPDEPCSVVGDHCCQDLQFPYCNNKYYSRINCNNGLTCSL